MSIDLGPEHVRPFTPREISKVLCGVIGCMVIHDDQIRGQLPAVLEQLTVNAIDFEQLDRLADRVLWAGPGSPSTWAAALGATVTSMMGWCKPTDVRTAVIWVRENINMICGLVSPDVSPTN